ncbi:hypothetical protein [Cohnella sp. GCM10012308]|uniref:hypothetical protein n=1 Tax=Cohnella sp. GCM10012308 TaxID=3317329 RepID=UPI003608E3F2
MSTKRKQEQDAELAAEEASDGVMVTDTDLEAAEVAAADPVPNPIPQPEPTAYEGQDQNIPAEPFGVFAAAEPEAAPPVTGPLIYLGPNIPGGRLLQSTVFRTEVPAYLQPLIAERPAVSDLIVPVSDMAAVQARIVKTGTAEYVAYQTLLQGGIDNGI